MKCPYCGFELEENTHFCSECGKNLLEVPTEPTASDTPDTEPIVIETPVAEVPAAPAVSMMESAATGNTKVYHGVLDKKPEKGSRWATIGTWGWFGIFLLLSIPLVNLIFLICWSFGGAKKQVKQSFARATLIYMLLTAILSVVCAILMHHFAPIIVEQLALWFGF